jgi:hypothetical protein
VVGVLWRQTLSGLAQRYHLHKNYKRIGWLEILAQAVKRNKQRFTTSKGRDEVPERFLSEHNLTKSA